MASLAASARLGLAIAARSALAAWDLSTANSRWAIPAASGGAAGFGPPAVSADGTICSAVRNGESPPHWRSTRAGDTKWRDSFNDASCNRPVLVGGLLLITSFDGITGFYAMDAATGDLRWSSLDTSSSRDEWLLAAAPQAARVLALHDSTLLAVPAIR
jgi:outer membrane protein assembly factor BamB